MKKSIITISLLFSVLSVNAQYLWRIGFNTGVSNYLGDIGGSRISGQAFINDLKMSQNRLVFGPYIRFKALPVLSFKLSYMYARIQGADSLSVNTPRANRNLSFRNDISEVAITCEFYVYQSRFWNKNKSGGSSQFKEKLNFNHYIFAGVAGFYNNPKTFYNGTWVELQPLETEGKKYSHYQVSIPMGLGFVFILNKNYRVGFEFGWRKTFTDYVDDVSSYYPDPSTLKSDLARKLSNRSGELNNTIPVYKPNIKRGNPDKKDAYIFTTINFSYAFKGNNSYKRTRH